MGWSIYVREHSTWRAECHEIGCTTIFASHPNRVEAMHDVAEHRRQHDEAWARQNEEWDKG